MSIFYKRLLEYFTGLTFSLIITGAAFYLAVSGQLMSAKAVIVLSVLAVLQLIVQLRFFLHLNEKGQGRQRLAIFGFMSIILFIIVAGSVWIMYHMNYNMMDMSSNEKEMYMMGQKDKGF